MSEPQSSNSAKEEKIAIFTRIRIMNQEGMKWSRIEAMNMADSYMVSAEQIYEWGQEIYDHYKNENNGYSGTTIQRVETFLNERYIFRRNAITKKIVYKDHKATKFESCKYNDIWRLLQHHIRTFGSRVKIPLGDVQTLLESNFVKEFHPIKDYFDHLPIWDQKTDWIERLANHVKCEDPVFWRTQFRKALVRMIACSVGNQENRIVMTLYSKKQSKGKNRFIRFLCPDVLSDYFKEDPITEHKDSEIALTQNFLWHFDELEGLDRKALTSLKSFISRSTSKQRMAYARQEETRQRIVSFWGSTNKEEFLTDVSNTRWLIFRVEDISWDYKNDETGIKNINIDDVWSQAYYLYQTGFNYRLDEHEREFQDQLNNSFETMGSEKQLIIKHLKSCEPNAINAEFLQPVDILEFLSKQVGSRMNLSPYSIGPAMAQLNFEQTKSVINNKTVKGYWVIKIAQLNGNHVPVDSTVEGKKIDYSEPKLPF